MKVTINPFLSRTLEAAKYNLPKLQNALDAAYNDKTKIVDSKEGITSARGSEKKNLFTAREGETRIREGELTNPLRFVAFSVGLDKFHKAHGAPSDELTVSILPAALKSWIDDKFTDATSAKRNGKRNGNVESVAAPVVPA